MIMSSSDPSLLSKLESLEKARDVLHFELGKASLLLTESKRVCEQRGCPCDLTAIPAIPNTLTPLVRVEIRDGAIEVENKKINEVCQEEDSTHPSSCSEVVLEEWKDIDAHDGAYLSLLLCSQPGYERPKKSEKGVVPKKEVSSSEKTISSPTSSSALSTSMTARSKEEEEGTKPKDPILYVCNPPSPELMACRDQYRRALEAMVECANTQIRLLASLSLL